jgi:P27 family predicted phage terminase small subunit|nr:MAG TPA: terminase small subunit [Caudoviricetes sp.]
MAEKRVRTRALTSSKSGKTNAVGQGRPRQNSKKFFVDEIIETNVKVPPLISNDKKAVDFWNLYMPILISRGSFKVAHTTLLAAYCSACSTYFSSGDELLAKGLVTLDENGYPKPPVANVKNQAFTQMVKSGSLLGLDPMSELRSGLLKDNQTTTDEKSDFSIFK